MAFQQHLETILATHSPPPNSTRQSQSPWLFLDAAQVLFSVAKRRVYTGQISTAPNSLSPNLLPNLEEQPKWEALASILEEIEHSIHFDLPSSDSYKTILVMCSDQGTCRQLREYLQCTKPRADQEDEVHDEFSPHSPGALMMRRKLRGYLAWKKDFAKARTSLFSDNVSLRPTSTVESQKRGTDGFRGKVPPNKRRRVRGGSTAAAGPSRSVNMSVQIPDDQPSHVADLLAEVQPNEDERKLKQEVAMDPLDNTEDYYELFDLQNLIVIHPYDGDMDDRILEELRPRYIVMYNPDNAFARRVEVSCLGVTLCFIYLC